MGIFRSKTGSQNSIAFQIISKLESLAPQTINQNIKIKEIHFHFQTCHIQKLKNQGAIGGCDSPRHGATPRWKTIWNPGNGRLTQMNVASVLGGVLSLMTIALELA